jgi:hypothetical protein
MRHGRSVADKELIKAETSPMTAFHHVIKRKRLSRLVPAILRFLIKINRYLCEMTINFPAYLLSFLTTSANGNCLRDVLKGVLRQFFLPGVNFPVCR